MLALAAFYARMPDEPRNPNASTIDGWDIGACLLALVVAALAMAFTSTGSIDRWWYLAYVQQYISAPAVDYTEPFFGSGNIASRFAFHPWMLALAVWAKCAGVQALTIYEWFAPALIVVLSFSAARFFATSMLPQVPAGMATVLTACVWIGGTLFPIYARTPEDKILAALVMAPVFLGVTARALDKSRPALLLLLLAAALALAWTHPLVFGFAAMCVLPVAMMHALITRSTASFAVIALTIAVTALCMFNGERAVESIAADNLVLENDSHPIVRIHLNQDRLRFTESGGYFVNPDLVKSPLIALALLSLVATLIARPRGWFALVIFSIVPLAFAFVPPLSQLLGELVLPWMVYRILWLIPFGLLLAVAVDTLARLVQVPRFIVVGAIAVIAILGARETIDARMSPDRASLALPDGPVLNELTAALSHLEPDALVAAPIELAERIPGLTSRHVLAASHRATTFFTGSMDEASERLRANAAIFSRYLARRSRCARADASCHLAARRGPKILWKHGLAGTSN